MQMIDQRRHGHDEERGRGVFNQMADKSVFSSLSFLFLTTRLFIRERGSLLALTF